MLFRLLSAFLCWIFKTPLYSGGSTPPWKWAEFERWIAHEQKRNRDNAKTFPDPVSRVTARVCFFFFGSGDEKE